MPGPALGIGAAILGGAAISGVSSIAAGRSQAAGANSAAEAQMYATDRQINAAERAQKLQRSVAIKRNREATDALTGAAEEAAGAEERGVRIGRKAQLHGNQIAADKLVRDARLGRDVLVKGERGAAQAELGAEREVRGALLHGSRGAQTAEVRANRRNIDFFRDIVMAENRQLKNWRVAGREALGRIQSGDLQFDPGYEFRRSEGERSLNRQAAARGGLLSGNQLAAAMDFNSGLASQEYQAAYGRALDIADRGQRAAELTGENIDRYGQRVSDARLNIGDAVATGKRERGDIVATSARTRGDILAGSRRAQAGYGADFLETRGLLRGGEATTRGNILAGAADRLGGIAAGRARDIGSARAQGALNVVNATTAGAQGSGNIIANAWGQYGTNVGNARLAQGDAAANTWSGINSAAQGGLGNWLLYDLMKPQAATAAGPMAGTNLLAGAG